MTLTEQIRAKFEETKFDSDKVIDWIFSNKDSVLEKKKKAFCILTTFPEYGEPEILNQQRKHNGR